MSHGDMSQMPMSQTYDNQSMKNMGNMAMHTSFFWGKDVEFLFAGWPGSPGRVGIYMLALAVVFLLAVGAEILSEAPKLKRRSLRPAVGALIRAVAFGARMALAYLVMLSVMSFNLGVFVVAVAGHAAGCFIVQYRALVATAVAPPALDTSTKSEC